MDTRMLISFLRKRVVIILSMLFLLCQLNAKAQGSYEAVDGKSIRDQPGNNDFVARLTRYDVKPDHQAAFRKAVSDYVHHSLNQQSNVLSEAYYEQEDQSVLWIIERWKSRIEFERARKSPSFKAMESLAKSALSKPAQKIDVKDLEPISKQQWRSVVRKTDDPITIMLFVDARGGTEHNFKTVYHTAMPQFRSEPGVITYQLSQLEADSSQFVTYEKFRNEDAFQYHLKFPPIKPVIDYLNTSIKKQPFQDGLHRLIEFAPLIRE